MHSSSRVPRFKIQTCVPCWTTLPLPISIFSSIDGRSTPTPVPLGYLIAEGLSFISTEVLIILTSSASSLAAITTKFGKVDK